MVSMVSSTVGGDKPIYQWLEPACFLQSGDFSCIMRRGGFNLGYRILGRIAQNLLKYRMVVGLTNYFVERRSFSGI